MSNKLPGGGDAGPRDHTVHGVASQLLRLVHTALHDESAHTPSTATSA